MDSLDNFKVSGVGWSNTTPALGSGNVQILSLIQRCTWKITLHDAIYCLEATNNLVSVSKIDTISSYVIYKGGKAIHYNADNSILVSSSLHRNHYYLDVQGQQKLLQGKSSNLTRHKWPLMLNEWHHNYGHVLIQAIQDLAKKGMVIGLQIDVNTKPSLTCITCIQGKAKHGPIPKFLPGGNHEKGDLTHSNLWGPTHVKSLQNLVYYISLIYNTTHIIQVHFLKDKSQAQVEVQNYLMWVHTTGPHAQNSLCQ